MDWIRKKKSWKSKKQKENNEKTVNPDVKYAIDRKVRQSYIGVFICNEAKNGMQGENR